MRIPCVTPDCGCYRYWFPWADECYGWWHRVIRFQIDDFPFVAFPRCRVAEFKGKGCGIINHMMSEAGMKLFGKRIVSEVWVRDDYRWRFSGHPYSGPWIPYLADLGKKYAFLRDVVCYYRRFEKITVNCPVCDRVRYCAYRYKTRIWFQCPELKKFNVERRRFCSARCQAFFAEVIYPKEMEWRANESKWRQHERMVQDALTGVRQQLKALRKFARTNDPAALNSLPEELRRCPNSSV